MADDEAMVEEDEEHNPLVEGVAEYSSKSDYSKPHIIQTLVMAVNAAGSKPMVPGYVTHLADKLGNVKPVTIEDARQAFCSGVETLKNNLTPEINKAKDCPEMIGRIEDAIKEIEKKYLYKELTAGRDKNNYQVLVPTGKSWMPKHGEKVVMGMTAAGKSQKMPLSLNGGWDGKVNAYWDEVLGLYRILFGQLNILIESLNYFKKQSRF